MSLLTFRHADPLGGAVDARARSRRTAQDLPRRDRDPRVLVVHFQFTQKNMIAFNTGKGNVDFVHAAYAVIASGISAR